MTAPSRVDSASDARTMNNAVRHTYRVLTDVEKAQMLAIKDKGAEFLELLHIAGGNPAWTAWQAESFPSPRPRSRKPSCGL